MNRRHRQPVPRADYAATAVVLAGGQVHDLLEIRDDLDLVGLSEMLAKQPRFSGASMGNPWSVAQHSVEVARLVQRMTVADPQMVLEGLLHDAAEALIGDTTRPAIYALAHFGGGSARDQLHAHVQRSVYASCGLRPVCPDLTLPPVVRQADEILFATEWRDLMPGMSPARADPAAIGPLRPLPWPAAQRQWLAMLKTLALTLGLHAPGIAAVLERDL